MTSRLRAFARLVTVVAVVTVYVALHVAITAGMDLRARDRFRDAPARAAAFTAALDRYADGEVSARNEVGDGAAWFADHAPPGESRSAVSAATGDARQGRVSLARERVAGLAARVEQEQAGLDRELNSSSTAALCCAAAAGALLVPALRLRRRRRSGVAEIVEVVGQLAPRQPWWRRPVFLMAGSVGYGLFTAGFLAVSMAQQQGFKMQLAMQVLLLPCGLAALGAGVLILRYTRPRSARGAAQALLADGRKPVLYLRGFADDDTAARVDDQATVTLHSREEQLAGALGAFGPVIAVGRPGEPLPRLGAARFYLPHDDWQPAVLRMMELSQLIVLRLGLSEGLWWEVEQARATQPARKLVLLALDGLSGVAQRLDELLPAPTRLDEVTAGDPSASAVITFDSRWAPHVHPVGPVPGAKTSRGMLARQVARAKEAARAWLITFTPTHHVARAMKAALASVGVRRRTMAWRAHLATQTSLWKGVQLVTAVGLLGWLVVRTLQLFGLG
ncbi:transferase [Streptomyces sp. NPDC050355]|uniref:transferase n=1 Tax=Streptomyces sp. NPDC050355 TaxID=3365609 RepID=UPI0037A0A72B